MFQCLRSRVLIAVSLLGYGLAQGLQRTGQTFLLDGRHYFVPPESSYTLPGPAFLLLQNAVESAGGLMPVTVISTNLGLGGFGKREYDSIVAGFEKSDDVYSSGFAAGIYVQYTGLEPENEPGGSILTQLQGLQLPVAAALVRNTSVVPQGPYFVDSDGRLHQAWRLFSDFAGAFTETVVPAAAGVFTVLPANLPGQSLAVAVPSRLYYTKTSQKPLAGVRLGVKDVFDLAGVKTSNGNRAWYDFYPPANRSALAVQRLIDAGAIVVGKQKTSQFANGETATADWVDYHAPFNPRGDGYQDPSSSSSGPAASVATYPWLDIAIGTDTGGSVRGPCRTQGLYGNRPSHGLLPLTGVTPLAPELDTVGLLARDPHIWTTAAQLLRGSNTSITSSFPKQILTYGFPEANSTSPAEKIQLAFLQNLTELLGARVSTFDLDTAWSRSTPPDADPNLEQFFNLTYPVIITKQQTRLVRDAFYAAYASANGGRRPYVNPVTQLRWGYGDSISDSLLDQANANRTVFADWFSKQVLRPDNKTCSDKILLYPGSSADPFSRDVYGGPPSVPFGYGTTTISVYAGGPDLVVPVGEASYLSDITGVEEVLPVTVDVLAAKGCDGMLFGLVQALVEKGIIRATVPGRSSVSGGTVLL